MKPFTVFQHLTALPTLVKGLSRVMTHSTLETKNCTRCKLLFAKTTEFFTRDKRNPDGLSSWCKKCKSLTHQEWHEANREPLREYGLKYYQANREKRAEYDRQYYQANKEQSRTKVSRRRARKQALPDTFTVEQWLACLEYHNFCCAVCGAQLRDLFGNVEPHADHWVALSNPDCPGTTVDNIICLCSQCNLSKHDNLAVDWLTSRYGTRKASKILSKIESYFEWAIKEKHGE
jgi:5-methylcytosine-specific restriction endonuclease McrA